LLPISKFSPFFQWDNGKYRIAKVTRGIDRIAFHTRHCERGEAIQCRRTEGWIASLRSQ
jgi:hypothetical protein